MLDEDQRRVILTDEDYCLVIAGAGAGKMDIPEYGALRDISREELKAIIEWMIANHFMLKTRGGIRCCIRHMMECIMRKR